MDRVNTASIVESCRALPGVSVEDREDGASLRLRSPEGRGRMDFYPLFPGLTLARIAVEAPSWPAPQLEACTPEAKGPLLINYCLRGRCELILNDRRHVFLTAGQVSLTERFAQKEYLYPGRLYEGVELFLDPETAEAGVPLLREGFDLDLTALRQRYCPGGETFLADLPLPEELVDRLLRTESAAGRKTGVIDLLALLLSEESPAKAVQPVYRTRSQVEIARQTERLLMEDLAHPPTLRQLAERFGVSEGSVKNYFFSVYGESVSRYTARRRMALAAELLRETRLSVIEVAGRAGYLNQSKFSAAFRRAYGRSPLEYRREGKLPGKE